jgi:GAF domain-containing protein
MREELERRDRILSAVSTVAQTLVRSKEWEPIIPECLELLGQAAGVEQAILFGIIYLIDLGLRSIMVSGHSPISAMILLQHQISVPPY